MPAWARLLSLALVAAAGLYVGVALLQQEAPVTGHDGPSPVPDRAPGPEPGPAERYYRKAEVDVPAVPLSRVPLIIPERAYYSRIVGKVRARIFIGADGSVDRVDILEAEPVRGLFEAAALDALRRMRYRAASIGGRPVRSQKVVEVVFDPRADDPRQLR